MQQTIPSLVFEIDGNDATGKSSLIAFLKPLFSNIEFKDRGILTKLIILIFKKMFCVISKFN